jgi:hypothetical protein
MAAQAYDPAQSLSGAARMMIEAAGFGIRRREQIDMPLSSSIQNLVSKLAKQRFLTLAQSPAC